MTPDQKKIIALAHLKLKESEKRLAPLFKHIEAALSSELASLLMNTLQQGDHPKSIQLSERVFVWNETDIDAWLEAKFKGAEA